MTERLAPNPTSPFATADPHYRHIFPALLFFGPPNPGVLAFTACVQLAVVPTEEMREAMPSAELPDGLCPICMQSMRTGEEPDDGLQSQPCRLCESRGPDGLCALCRMELHERWTAQGRPDGVTLQQGIDQTLKADAELDAQASNPAGQPPKASSR